MTEYQFTKDWFNWAPQIWEQLIPHLPERKKFLEIGSFEGRSMTWIVENMLADDAEGASVVCIDTWEGGEEHSEEDMDAVFTRFLHNKNVAQDRYWMRTKNKNAQFVVETVKGKSSRVLPHLTTNWEKGKLAFDFIYIDGSHIAKDVLTDAVMAWPLLKPKGIMVFDDYMWGDPRDILHRPKPAIDAFTNIFAEEAEIVHVGYQLAVRKKGEE
jgi:predicted O-methyltransferase YrrM